MEEFLNDHAALTGSLHDPDANYNKLFPNELTRQFRPVPGRFEDFTMLQGPAEKTVVSFRDGTEERLRLVAASRIDLYGLSDGQDFFERCCGGSFLDVSSIIMTFESRSLTWNRTYHRRRTRLPCALSDQCEIHLDQYWTILGRDTFITKNKYVLDP